MTHLSTCLRVSRLGPVKEELAKSGREDIDWGKLSLAIARLKAEHKVTEEGILTEVEQGGVPGVWTSGVST